MDNGKRVLLFRKPKEDGEDSFEKVLTNEGFIAGSVPVLSFNFVNEERLVECLSHPENFSSIVFTSQRAVEATALALEKTMAQDDNDSSEEKKPKPSVDMACYAVGESTLHLAEAAGFEPKRDSSQSGNADNLAKHIISDIEVETAKPILYPCGNLRRDTLSTELQKAGFKLTEIVVYETGKSSRIMLDVESLIQKQGMPDYIVYFSPSGVQYTVDLFTEGVLPSDQVKLVAIGKTTRKEMEDRGLAVFSTAESPTPDGLLNALTASQCT